MTFAALFALVVLSRIYAGNVVPIAGWHGEPGVTANTEFPTPVDLQFLRFIRVVKSCTVAILARNHGMVGTFDFFNFVIMTLVA